MSIETLSGWWPGQPGWTQQPGCWVLISLGSGILASWLLWLALGLDARRSGRLGSFLSAPAGMALTRLMRSAWLIVPGYAALLAGAASPRLMGLTQIRWTAPFGSGLAFSVLIVAMLLLAGLSYRRTKQAAHLPWPSLPAGIAVSAGLLLEAGALQWHWAFYRSATVEAATIAGATAPLYWGTWLGASLVLLEACLSPTVWRDLRLPGHAEPRILQGVLLLATSVLFLLSRNFWLAWAVHAVVVLTLEPRLRGSVSPAPGNKNGRRQTT